MDTSIFCIFSYVYITCIIHTYTNIVYFNLGRLYFFLNNMQNIKQIFQYLIVIDNK